VSSDTPCFKQKVYSGEALIWFVLANFDTMSNYPEAVYWLHESTVPTRWLILGRKITFMKVLPFDLDGGTRGASFTGSVVFTFRCVPFIRNSCTLAWSLEARIGRVFLFPVAFAVPSRVVGLFFVPLYLVQPKPWLECVRGRVVYASLH
jgi:hypothetical protein